MAKIQKKATLPLLSPSLSETEKSKAAGAVPKPAEAKAEPIPNSDFYDVEPQQFAPVSIPAPAIELGQRKNALSTRLGALMEKPKEKGAQLIEHFLTSVPVVYTKESIKDFANMTIEGIDFQVSRLGMGADLVADAKIAKAAGIKTSAASGRDNLMGMAADLEVKSRELLGNAESIRETGGVVSAKKKKEAEQMWSTGHCLAAIGTRISQVAGSANASAKAFCEEGGSLAFKFKSKVVKGKARVTHAGKAGRAAAIEFGGKTLKTLFGRDTLRSTGFSVHGGVRANFISKKMNAGLSGVAYFPPLSANDNHPPESKNKKYTDAMSFEWSASAATPVGGVGYNSRRGVGAKVNLLFMSASFDEYAERVFVGIPGVCGVTFGKDKERGSEVSIGAGIGLAGDAELGAYAGYGVTVHTSLLDPVNKYVTRPIAQTVVNANNKVVGAVKNVFRKMTGKPSPDDKKDPHIDRPGFDAPADVGGAE